MFPRSIQRWLSHLTTAALLAGVGAGLCTSAQAHGPTRQKVVEKIAIDAPADKVWARIKNFGALQDWHPAVASSPADKGNEEGSVRSIALKGGGALVETLESYNDAQMKYSYRMANGGALPVANYTSTITVTADGAKSTVEWRGAFYRSFPGAAPPPGQSDDDAIAAVTGVYKSGLENLKKLAEAK